MRTSNPYSNSAERVAWDQGYACYRPVTRDGGDAFTALWARLDKVERQAAYDGWVCAIIDANRSPQVADPTWRRADTIEAAADQFAIGATRDILAADHGLSITEALERKPPRTE